MNLNRGLFRAADTRASGLALFTADEAKAETTQVVPWSHPCQRITDDLGGPLFKFMKIKRAIDQYQGATMQFIYGFIYGAGFTTAAILVVVISHKLFGAGLC